MNELYVLEEDQARAQELYETIISKRKEMIQHNVDALHHTLAGNYIETAECDVSNQVAYQEMLSAYHELDKLQAKRIHRERVRRLIEKLQQEVGISVVSISMVGEWNARND